MWGVEGLGGPEDSVPFYETKLLTVLILSHIKGHMNGTDTPVAFDLTTLGDHPDHQLSVSVDADGVALLDPCPRCEGAGVVCSDRYSGPNWACPEYTCPQCSGSGEVPAGEELLEDEVWS